MHLQHLLVFLLPWGAVEALDKKLKPTNSSAIAPKKFILEAEKV